MSKPTVFFSHSSKDKELIIKLKDKLMSYTGGTLNIFLSSDGQSIPFGTNWIHKIEEGLKEAKIMFVFVTTNSITSGWIYFEAGFAYSKDIHVIPVGIGIEIGAIKAPLNLLQGFNLTSEDSLNNFISIINKEFDYSFAEQFSQNDYDGIINSYLNHETMVVSFDKIVKSVSFSLRGMIINGPSKQSFRNNKKVFNQIESYYEENGIKYSKTELYGLRGANCLSALGLLIKCTPQKTNTGSVGTSDYKEYHDLDVSISPYNFEKSFALYMKLNDLFEEPTRFYVHISLNDCYTFVCRQEDYSALLLEYPTRFEQDKDYVGSFKCNDLALSFAIFDKISDRRKPNYVLSIGYSPDTLNPQNIEKLVDWLIEARVIIKK